MTSEEAALVEKLVEANVALTRELTELTRLVMGSPNRVVQVPQTPSPNYVDPADTADTPSFEEFAGGDDLSTLEKLFYSEAEEDEKFLQETGVAPADDAMTKEILREAGLEPVVQQA